MSIRKYKLKNRVGYQATVQLTPTKQVSKKFGRKIDAEEWERDQRQQQAKGGAPASNPTMTVAELAAHWLKYYCIENKTSSSVKRDGIFISKQILPALGKRRLADLKFAEAQRWYFSLRSEYGLAPKTANNCLVLLKKMLNDAIGWEFISHNPIAALKPKRLPQADFDFWTHDEAATFLQYAREDRPDAYPVFAIALYTGLRRGEIQGLMWDCVDLTTGKIIVKRSYCDVDQRINDRTKSKKIRHVPINQSLREVLVEQRQQERGPLVVPTFDYRGGCRLLARIAKRAGVKAIRFHDMRHTFASHLVMAGVPIYDVKQILGHSTVQMTERYAHLAPQHLLGKSNCLDFGDRAKVADVIQLSANGERK